MKQLLDNHCYSSEAVDEIANIDGTLDNILITDSIQGFLDFIGIVGVLCMWCVKGKNAASMSRGIHYFISIVVDLLLRGQQITNGMRCILMNHIYAMFETKTFEMHGRC
eukprot:953854_1